MMRRWVIAGVWAGAWAVACAALPGCSAPARSTALTMSDLDQTTAVMAAKLRDSDLLAGRGPESSRMVIAISKVENLSSDLIPVGEQWLLMEKVRSSLPVVELGKQRNIAFVIPAEHLRGGRARGTLDEEYAAGRRPTHEMAATFRSGTRAAGRHRTDAYLVEYRITSLETGELEWAETFEFKRAAVGLSYD
jgi:hypothetical protein